MVQLQSDIEQFLTDWTAHGASLSAGYCIPHQQFIVFSLDEANQQATGCSIDKSVHFIQALEQSLSVHLLDKMNVHYVEKNTDIFENDVSAQASASVLYSMYRKPSVLPITNAGIDVANAIKLQNLPVSDGRKPTVSVTKRSID